MSFIATLLHGQFGEPALLDMFIIYAFIILYFVIGETSRIQTTPGKFVFRLKAYDSEGFPPSLLSVAACISSVISTIAVVMTAAAALAFVCGIKITALCTTERSFSSVLVSAQHSAYGF